MPPATTPLTDAEIVHQTRQGNFEVVNVLWARHGDSLYRFALTQVRDDATARDCVQETFVAACQRIDSFDPTLGTLRGWLFTILHNQCCNVFRRAQSHGPLTDASTIPDPRSDDPAEVAAARDASAVILQVVAECLTTDEYELLYARVVEGLSHEELAQRFGVSVAAIKSRLHQARKKLKAELERRGWGGGSAG